MHDIYIFDFDYTLYKTCEQIILWSPRGGHIINNQPCKLVGSDEWHDIIIAEDEKINNDSFVNFYDVNFDCAKPIRPIIEIFNSKHNKMILSARPQCLEDKIKTHLGNVEYIGLQSSNPEDKIKIITQFKNPCVYEDSNSIINSLIKMRIDCVKVVTTETYTNLKFHYHD